MLVMILETVPVGLRGELTRWLIEPHPGVFVGHVSALVRDRLWQKCCQGLKGGGVVQLWSTNNEQRFQVRTFGATRREVVDFDGLQMIRLPVEPEGKADSKTAAKPGRRAKPTPVPRGF
jgi:CRISPR-associated protein Cas2